MKSTTDQRRFDVEILYFDRRKDDVVPDNAPKRIEIDLDIRFHQGKWELHPDRVRIIERARELVKINCPLEKVRKASIYWPFIGSLVEDDVLN